MSFKVEASVRSTSRTLINLHYQIVSLVGFGRICQRWYRTSGPTHSLGDMPYRNPGLCLPTLVYDLHDEVTLTLSRLDVNVGIGDSRMDGSSISRID